MLAQKPLLVKPIKQTLTTHLFFKLLKAALYILQYQNGSLGSTHQTKT